MLRDCGVCSLSCGICSEEGRPTYWRSVTWRVPAGRSQQPPRPETQAAAHGKDEEVHGQEAPPVDDLPQVGGGDEAEQGAGRNEITLHGVGRPSAGAGARRDGQRCTKGTPEPLAFARTVVTRKTAAQRSSRVPVAMAPAATRPATMPTRLNTVWTRVNVAMLMPRIMWAPLGGAA